MQQGFIVWRAMRHAVIGQQYSVPKISSDWEVYAVETAFTGGSEHVQIVRSGRYVLHTLRII